MWNSKNMSGRAQMIMGMLLVAFGTIMLVLTLAGIGQLRGFSAFVFTVGAIGAGVVWLARGYRKQADESKPEVRHFNKGVDHSANDEWRQAIAAFDRAIAADPSHVYAHIERGFAYRELGNASAAIVDLEKGTELTNDKKLIADIEADIEDIKHGDV